MKRLKFMSAVPSPAMLVAMIALFVALSGISYAAGLAKNSVGTKQLKNNAVTSKKIKKGAVTASDVKSNSIGGNQVNEATLAKVPDADTLDGADSASFAPAKSVLNWNVTMNRGDAPKTLGAAGPFTFMGHCDVDGANSDASVTVKTSVDNTFINGDSDFDIVDNYTWLSFLNFTPNERDYTSGEPRFLDPATGFSIFDGDGESTGIWVGFPGADCRFVAHMPVNLP